MKPQMTCKSRLTVAERESEAKNADLHYLLHLFLLDTTCRLIIYLRIEKQFICIRFDRRLEAATTDVDAGYASLQLICLNSPRRNNSSFHLLIVTQKAISR